MVRLVTDSTYHFQTLFNDNTGEYLRAFDVDEDPFMAEYPHLIDVGVMGHCEHGKSGLCMKVGIKCYQDGLNQDYPNMTLENYKKIIDWSKGKLFEVALGGRGDPDMHENFEDILKYSRENRVVPNFTTSGLGMTVDKAKLCKQYCGAVAVSQYSRLESLDGILVARPLVKGEEKRKYTSSKDIPIRFTLGNKIDTSCYYADSKYIIEGKVYSEVTPDFVIYDKEGIDYDCVRVYNESPKVNYTMNAIKMLMDEGVKTNIHFVLSNSTIDEALLRIKYNGFPKGINAVVFLLHKPVGLGDMSDVLQITDRRVKEFFELVDLIKLPYKIGFDSCSIPAVLRWNQHIDVCSIDTCEGGRFSMYIASDMTALPCSFDNQAKKYAVQLSDDITIKDAWDSVEFESFRLSLRDSCPNCEKREFCMGGCPLERSIVLCDSEDRELC